MNNQPFLDDLFERRLSYPDSNCQDRLRRLVGLDEYKDRLSKILRFMIGSEGLGNWINRYHPGDDTLLRFVSRKTPLIVLSGDVGSGKTELAETIGDAVARQENIDVTLFPLSLSARGQGRVGEMTKLISQAFESTITEAKKLQGTSGRIKGGIILLIDEADALAQSRETTQMHHEDRAGVNALIRGIDRLGNEKVPAAVIMCTNRLEALDPAVRRRAFDVLTFQRPDENQRRQVVGPVLERLGLSVIHIDQIIAATGRRDDITYGFSFSDLITRLLPAIILDAYPDKRVEGSRAVEIAQRMLPTPPFKDGGII